VPDALAAVRVGPPGLTAIVTEVAFVAVADTVVTPPHQLTCAAAVGTPT